MHTALIPTVAILLAAFVTAASHLPATALSNPQPVADQSPAPAEKQKATMTQETGILFRTTTVDGVEHAGAVYVPREYDPSRKWPCIVFLHGRGECGTDGQKQLAVGLIRAVLFESQNWPAIIVCPQKPTHDSLWGDHEALVLEALNQAKKEWNIDDSRVVLTGLSQGGNGTWVIGARNPKLFRRLAPICGFGDPAQIAPGVANRPIWAFHGQKDNVVPPEQTTSIATAIRAVSESAALTVTLYPEADHNSWDRAYSDPALAKWLLANNP